MRSPRIPLALLPLLVIAADAPTAATPTVRRHVITEAHGSWPLPLPPGFRPRWISVANAGSNDVVAPRLSANGRPDWFSTSEILAAILAPGMSEREKALAIWRFLVDHRYHDAPAHSGLEMHDPVRFLNVYGYGFCDDSAVNFMVLAEQAGLRARVWGLSGHVVPEAFFEGNWRMLDPDGKIFYLEDDGRSIAGIKTLEQRPDLIRKHPSPFYRDSAKLIAIYCSVDDNRLSENYRRQSEATHTMAFTLRPGESLTRHYDNWGLYFAGEKSPRPPKATGPERFGNGRFVFEPIFADGVFALGAEQVDSLRAMRDGSGWSLTSNDATGSLVYRFAGPYPFLDGAVHLAGRGRFSLAFSETGESWSEIWVSGPAAPVNATVPLSAHFRTRHGNPMYAYYLRLTVHGSVRALRFESDIQVAPASLPALTPGDNTLAYRDASAPGRRVRLEFAYDPSVPQND